MVNPNLLGDPVQSNNRLIMIPQTSPKLPAEASSVGDLRNIFIATSTEALDKEWLTNALTHANEKVRAKYPDVHLRLWTEEFEPGTVTAKRLIEIASEFLGAIVVLTGDDFVTERGQTTSAPRDNLILETGLFLARTGLQNVLPLREKGSKWPSDLLGVNFKVFDPPAEEESSDILSLDISRSIVNFVSKLMKARTSTAGRALLRSSARAMEYALELKTELDSGPSETPINFPFPGDAYLDAVNEVTSQFTTTTYLTSDFWTSTELKVLAANQGMLKRIKEAGGTARRIILLQQSPDSYIEAQRKERRALRLESPDKVDQMNRAFDRLAKTHRDLTKAGFEVKVIYDRSQVYRQLPREVAFKQWDTELALYDKSRLDIFAGFTSNNQPTVQTYSAERFEKFSVLSAQVEKYFSLLWDSPEDAYEFEEFASRVEKMIEEANREIDYTSNWLYKYDDASDEDGELKDAESEFVLDQLKKKHGEVIVDGHIDLGTCTGRYLRELTPYVNGGKIVGVDNDRDCLEVLKSRVKSGKLDARVEIREGDIRRRQQLPSDRFGLVTCMMGTLCHLDLRGDNGSGRFEDDWQVGLENAADLLAKDGDAFIAIWDEQACVVRPRLGRQLLSIYEQRDSTILCRQSPSEGELKARIEQAGLKISHSDLVKDRLRVFHLEHTT